MTHELCALCNSVRLIRVAPASEIRAEGADKAYSVLSEPAGGRGDPEAYRGRGHQPASSAHTPAGPLRALK